MGLFSDLFVNSGIFSVSGAEQFHNHVDDLLEIVDEGLDPAVIVVLTDNHVVRTSLLMNYGHIYPLI